MSAQENLQRFSKAAIFLLIAGLFLSALYLRRGAPRSSSLEEPSQPLLAEGVQELSADQQRKQKKANALDTQVYRLWKAQKYDEALPEASHAVQLKREIYGETHPEVAFSLFNLAAQYDGLGRYDRALGTHRQALKIRLLTLGTSHPLTAESYFQIGLLYRQIKQPQLAISSFDHAIQTWKDALGIDHEQVQTALMCLGDTYLEIADFENAQSTYMALLAILKANQSEHPTLLHQIEVSLQTVQVLRDLNPDQRILLEEANQLDSKVNRLWKSERYNEALPMAKQAVKLKEQVFGNEHPEYGNSLSNLSAHYYALGMKDLSIDLANQVLQIREKELGRSHPSTLDSLYNIGIINFDSQHYEHAKDSFEKFLSSYVSAYPRREEDQPTEKAYDALMKLFESCYNIEQETGSPVTISKDIWSMMSDYSQKNLPVVLNQMKKAYDLSDDDPLFALPPIQLYQITKTQLLDVEVHKLFSAGDYDGALEIAKENVSIRKSILGDNHLLYAFGIFNLAAQYDALNNCDEAEALYLEALKLFLKQKGRSNRTSASISYALAGLYRKQQRHQEALRLLEPLLQIDKTEFGPLYPQLLGLFSLISRESDDIGKASQSTKQLIDIQANQKGTHHYEVLDARLYSDFIETLERLPYDQRKEIQSSSQLHEEAVDLAESGNPEEALPLAEDALNIRERIFGDDHQLTALSLYTLGGIYARIGENDTAMPLYEKALGVQRAILGESHPQTLLSLLGLGSILLSNKQYEPARQCLEECYRFIVQKNLSKKLDLTTILAHLGDCFFGMGNLPEAIQRYQNALIAENSKLLKNEKYLRRVLSSLGNCHFMMGNYWDSKKAYQDALEFFKESDEDSVAQEGDINIALSAVNKELGDLDKAVDSLEQAIKVCRSNLIAGRQLAYAYMGLSAIYTETGDIQKASDTWIESQKEWAIVKVKGLEDKFACSMGEANMYIRSGKIENALRCVEEAYEVFQSSEESRHPVDSRVLKSLGSINLLIGNDRDAEKYLLKAFNASLDLGDQGSNLQAFILNELGFLLWLRGNHDKAESLFVDSLQILLGNLETSIEQSSERQAILIANQIREFLGPLVSISDKDEEVYGYILTLKGLATYAQINSRVRESPEEIVKLQNELEAISNDLATQSFLIIKERSFSEEIPKGETREEIDRLTVRKEEIEGILANQSAEYREWKTGKDPIHLADFRQLVPDGSAFVDFFEYAGLPIRSYGGESADREQRLVAFILKHATQVQRVDLGPMGPIVKLIRKWKSSIAEGKSADSMNISQNPSDLLHEFRQLIWNPLEEYLSDADLLLISPDGELNNFPLSVLPGKSPGTCLIEDYNIVRVPVPQQLPQILKNPDDDPAGQTSLLLVGDVDYTGAGTVRPSMLSSADEVEDQSQDLASLSMETTVPRGGGSLFNFSQLAGTKTEVKGIRDLFSNVFPTSSSKILSDADATEDNFRNSAPDSRFIHLATHGFFAPENLRRAFVPMEEMFGFEVIGGPSVNIAGWHPGLLSGIAMAGANQEPLPGKDDGVLSALELGTLDLTGTELMVLSACETGLGKIAGGEGVLGLQRACHVAGARTAITSLWQVDDAYTQALMVRFYENLWNKKMGKLEALRDAQLAVLNGEIGPGSSISRSQDVEDDTEVSSEQSSSRGVGAIVEVEEPDRKRTHPKYWGAWVLSGDWN